MGEGSFRLVDRAAREREEEALAPAAARSTATRGRAVPEPEDPLRTAFERDRDRILHAKAFRRLKHKTQVFLNPDGDHFVTRLTHTLQVTQVARSLARALGLNEAVAEAVALGHDLGHSPFGHIGEDALEPYVPGGWHHAAQGVRIVEVLEHLNLTWEVRDGIRAHSWKITPPPTTRGASSSGSSSGPVARVRAAHPSTRAMAPGLSRSSASRSRSPCSTGAAGAPALRATARRQVSSRCSAVASRSGVQARSVR